MVTKIIKDSVQHQGIGGKKFIVDEQITETLSNEEVCRQSIMGNIACINFINRRKDFTDILTNHFEHKLYYGKVDGLGYIVAEDEFKEEGE